MEIHFPVSNKEEYDSIVDMLTKDNGISNTGWWDPSYSQVKLDLKEGYVCMSSGSTPIGLAESGLSLAQLLIKIKEEPLKVGGFPTTIHEDLSVTVGCTTFAKEEILAFMRPVRKHVNPHETLTMSGTKHEVRLAIESALSMGYVFHRNTEDCTSYQFHASIYGTPCTVVFTRHTKDMYTYEFVKRDSQVFDAKVLIDFISNDYEPTVIRGQRIDLHPHDIHIAFSWSGYRFAKADIEKFTKALNKKAGTGLKEQEMQQHRKLLDN